MSVIAGDTAKLRKSYDADGKVPITWMFKKRSGMVDAFSPFISRILQANLLDLCLSEDLNQRKTMGRLYFRRNRDTIHKSKLKDIQDELSSKVKPIPIGAIVVLLGLYDLGMIAGTAAFSWVLIMNTFENAGIFLTRTVKLHLV